MSAAAEGSTEEAARWLRFAAEDLRAAETLRSSAVLIPRHVATLAQQGAEKALKAGLVSLDIDPPRTHNLQLLVDLLPNDWQVHESPADLPRLSQWLVESRYPGEWPEATLADADRALVDARSVYSLMCADLASGGVSVTEST